MYPADVRSAYKTLFETALPAVRVALYGQRGE